MTVLRTCRSLHRGLPAAFFGSWGLVVLLAISVAGAESTLTDEPTREWRVGPIHYILSVEQDHRYKDLKTPSVDYRLLMEAEGGLRPVARPTATDHVKNETLAYSLPLQGWPEANYRIEVRVTDNLTGLTVAGEGSFRVRSPGRKGP